jgi:cytochrome c-type biogenesis protein CcmH/NrfF
MKCPNCHQTVTRKSKFCANCGNPISFRQSRQPVKTQKKLPLSLAIVLVGLGIVVGLAIFKFASKPATNTVLPVANVQSAVLDIASEFTCPCGSCSDGLDVCTCDAPRGAVEARNFIAQKIQEGHERPHIVEMVQKKYGSLRNTSNPVFKFETPK